MKQTDTPLSLFRILQTGLLLFAFQVSSAKTFYAAGDGSGDFVSIQEAADILNPGIQLSSEMEFITMSWSSGNENNWILFKSEHKWGAVLDGNNNTEKIGWSLNANGNYIRVEDFEKRK